ncbi:hypothetical protein MACK_001813 [Theileria orientalis]|uniref:NUC153 domain-containing protein n=1 Tax=Theileria orientalis TaxID=68886 RepID=A0A976MAI2_THEOR|nr:hypothetical protein MACK_001813 [Theileria orientalis]
MDGDSTDQGHPEDERFKLKARFRKKKEKKFETDERFNKVFKEDVKAKTGPKVDPFGRPLDKSSFGEVYSSSEDEEEEVSETEEEEEKEQIEYGDETDRIAVVGCDWDNITADDLFVLFETLYRSINNNDFVRAVKRAAIYLSDIGEKKISEENVSGPSLDISVETRDEEEDDETRQEALRKYQRERSRYYYGVVELESVEKARILYDELDGSEVSFAIDGLDLRFIPPSVEFPRKPTTESFKIPDNYEPPISTQSALRHSKVECKWDTTPVKRFKTLTKRFTEKELASLDLSEYLASDESDDNAEENIEKYKKLLAGEGEDEEVDKLSRIAQKHEEDDQKDEDEEDDEDQDEEDLDNTKISATVGNFKISFGPNVGMPSEEESIKEEYSSRSHKKNKQKSKREKRRLEEEPIEDRHFDMKYLKSKKHKDAKKQQPGFKSNFDDERLTRIFKDPKFAIDTTDPNYKETEFNKKLLEQKSKRKN